MDGKTYVCRFVGAGEVRWFYEMRDVMYVVRGSLTATERAFVTSLLERDDFVHWSAAGLQ